MTSVWKLPIALAVVLLAGQAAPAPGAEGLGEELTRSRLALEELRRNLERLRPLLHRTEPAGAPPPIRAECDGIGQAHEPRVSVSHALVLEPRAPVAPVLRFDALPGVEALEQVARCLYIPLAWTGYARPQDRGRAQGPAA
jgi:hypothetical protein